jgi:TRAP-type C4-dicarboxylate transport system permease large subunit
MILVPPLALIFAVLGSIIMGVATVNQAGAIGAVGAMIMAGYRLYQGRKGAYWPVLVAAVSLTCIIVISNLHPLNVKNIQTGADLFWIAMAGIAVAFFLFSVIWSGWRTFKVEDTLRGVMVETAKTTSLVFIILLGAAMLTAAFRAFGGEDLVRDFLTGLPGGFWAQFFIVMAVIFVLGFFLDFIEIAVVVVPIVAPILLADPSANVTAVWLGVMIGLNIQTSFLTPPFGFALFYLRGVAPPDVKTISMYRGVVAFICLQLLALVIVAASPPLVNYLPTRISLTSDTAPPPVNPKLQACIEEHVFALYDAEGAEIRSAIERARNLDLSYIPEDLAKDFTEGLDKAAATFELVEEIRVAEGAVTEAAERYRPLHQQVRDLQADMRRHEREIEESERRLRLIRDEDVDSRRQREALEQKIEQLQAEAEALETQIPAEWTEQNRVFTALTKAEDKARAVYRRNVDDAYDPVKELLAVLRDSEALAALEGDLRGLSAEIGSLEPAAAVERISEVSSLVSGVEGAGDIRSLLNKARRALKDKEPKPKQAREQIAAAQEAFEQEMAWRRRAERELLPELSRYEAVIGPSIGVRQQPRLMDEVALAVASCSAHHRDLSLHF